MEIISYMLESAMRAAGRIGDQRRRRMADECMLCSERTRRMEAGTLSPDLADAGSQPPLPANAFRWRTAAAV
jgi:hypothetical protein